MLINKIYFWIIFFTFLCPQDDWIKLTLDTFGQSELYLNEINPFYQSPLKIGIIPLSPVNGVPHGSSTMDFDFIGYIDSSAITSQFNYSRGSDSFRETKILANNPIGENKNLLFKAHGRKYPGIGIRSLYDEYDSFGEGYILQNYLIDYIGVNEKYSIRVNKYHHKEDIVLPIAEIEKTRTVQIDGLGISFGVYNYTDFLGLKYDLDFNYYNTFHHVIHPSRNYENQEYGLTFNYTSYLKENIKSLLSFDYKEIKNEYIIWLNGEPANFDTNIFILNYSKCGILYGPKNYNFMLGFDWLGSNSDIADLEQEIALFFDFNWHFSKIGALNIKRDRIFSDLTVGTSSVSDEISDVATQYSLLSLKMKMNRAIFIMSIYNLGEIYYNGELQNENSLFKAKIELGSGDILNSPYDIAMSLIYHDYINYSPIDFNLNYQLQFKYLNFYKRKKYIPYFNFQIQMTDFNPAYKLNLASFDYFPVSESSTNSLSYYTSKLEFGILFDRFIISYHILNPGRIATYGQNGDILPGSQYYFPDELTDIQSPLYQMNYITLQWQFLD